MTDTTTRIAPRVSPWNNPVIRGWIWQFVLLVALLVLTWSAVENAATNMASRGIPTGFDFWNRSAGFDINQTLIPFTNQSTYGQAFWVGLVNTLLVSVIAIVLATIIGFLVGVGRLSKNWIVARLATIYVETLRNIPLLLQLLFWYNAVLKPLPNPRDSLSLFGAIYINNRGLILPEWHWGQGADYVLIALCAGIVAAIVYTLRARRLQAATGQQSPVFFISLGLVVGLPLLVFAVMGAPLSLTVPQLRGFNFVGGIRVLPEFVALLLGLSLYTACFIAEIVRSGIQSVAHGQSEAAHALGVRQSLTLRLIVIPQAMRVIIPPLTNQYLNLIKNSSLAVFVGYPDLVQVFMGTVLNQTGAAVQVIAITMGIYLLISLLTSLGMGIYNQRMTLKER